MLMLIGPNMVYLLLLSRPRRGLVTNSFWGYRRPPGDMGEAVSETNLTAIAFVGIYCCEVVTRTISKAAIGRLILVQ